MGKFKGGDSTPYIDYHLSFHLGFCTGPVDSLEGIWMKDKEVHGEQMLGGDMVAVDKPELFGGNQREGGVKGNIHFRDGNFAQLVPGAFASRVGLDVEDTPAFRGIASLYFFGPDDSGGFKVSANYPTVPPVKARFRRGSWSLGATHAIIENVIEPEDEEDEDSEPVVRHDSNGSHIIYECLVDRIWGMGGAPSLIDAQSFRDAAETLFNEKFGLSMKWVRSTTIEAFVQEILDHINALFFFNPGTGLATLKLLRNDYDRDNLPDLGPSNSRLITFRRKLWGETANEIVVTWTNPLSEEEETITYQSLGNIAMQGEVVNEGRNYYGVRSPTVASEICARDIVSASYPLAMATVEVDRRQWKVLPGDVVNFTWPVEGYGIGRIIMRVMEIDYGKPAEGKMRLELVEDVWGLDSAEFLGPPPESEWKNPDQDPEDPIYEFAIPTKFAAAPYPVVQTLAGRFYDPSDDDYPVIVVAIMSTPTTQMSDLQRIVVWKPGILPNGDPGYVSIGERNLTGKANTTIALIPESISIVTFANLVGGEGPVEGGFVLVGDRDEFGAELIQLLHYLGDGQWEVARGVIDTIPRAWPSMTPVWFLGPDFYAFDWNEPLADTTLDYRIQPRTSEGVRDLSGVTVQFTEHPARHYFPFRPANVKVDGVDFGIVDHSQDHNPRVWEIPVTWSSRHRKNEDVIIRKWDEPPVAPEPGQTTSVILREGEVEWHNLPDNSFDIDVMETGRGVNFNVEVPSFRDDFRSLQNIATPLRLYPKGYGCDWGYFYGGWPGTPLDLVEAWEFLYEAHDWTGHDAIVSVEGDGWLNYLPVAADAGLRKVNLAHDTAEIEAVEVVLMRFSGAGDWIGELRFRIGSGNFDEFSPVTIVEPPDADSDFVIARWDMTAAPGWSGTLTGLELRLWLPETEARIQSISLIKAEQ
ncbi:phage tail protein [Neoaquamicrobium sediminum]|uniref:phage tail protein n=1 Tax=Neoaquamicrobium sediminum TaxID=1849104 RepID=UPI0015666700|nr:phage tail protein [Mesorhizobium sediminum]NRC54134.1 hypothetical protein [Mesorhizobium sediminum]